MMGRGSEESIPTKIDVPNAHGQKEPKVCSRCGGYTEESYFMDRYDLNCLWAVGQRCLNCGEITDAVILANKQRDPSTCRKRTRRLRLPTRV